MAMKITVNHPGFDKGTELDLPNLGSVENGGSLEITQEMQDAFQGMTGKTVKEFYEGSEMIKVEGSTPKKEEK